MSLSIDVSHPFIVALSGICKTISSMAPSHLSSANSLIFSLCTNPPLSLIPPQLGDYIRLSTLYQIFEDSSLIRTSNITFHLNCINNLQSISFRYVFSLPHYRFLRALSSNQLTGTISPELSNLTALIVLYSQNIIFSFARMSLTIHL